MDVDFAIHELYWKTSANQVRHHQSYRAQNLQNFTNLSDKFKVTYFIKVDRPIIISASLLIIKIRYSESFNHVGIQLFSYLGEWSESTSEQYFFLNPVFH